MQGCCHRTAKSSNLGAEAGKTFDLTDLPPKDYGPVANDASECIELPIINVNELGKGKDAPNTNPAHATDTKGNH